MNATTITRRLEACNCGCGGSDPWHARAFDRILSDVRDERGERTVIAFDRNPVQFRRTATARLPWGEGRPVLVVEVEMAGRALGWFATGTVL